MAAEQPMLVFYRPKQEIAKARGTSLFSKDRMAVSFKRL
jgi:hypothetical protein